MPVASQTERSEIESATLADRRHNGREWTATTTAEGQADSRARETLKWLAAFDCHRPMAAIRYCRETKFPAVEPAKAPSLPTMKGMAVPRSTPARSSRHRDRPAPLPTPDALRQAFDQFLQLDVADGDASADTVSTYQRRLNQYLRWCDEQGLAPASATAEDIKRYRRDLVETKKQQSATIALTLVVIRRFYTCAVEQGLVKTNPAIGIKAPRAKHDRAETLSFLEPSELAHLLAAVPQNNQIKSRRDRALLAVMGLQGPRTIELHRANVGDLVQQGNHWGLRVEAKRHRRTVPLRSDIAIVLWQYLDARRAAGEVLTASSPLFLTVGNRFGGQRLSRRGVRYVVDQYLEAAQLKHSNGRTLSAHSLRHTAGTLGLRSGADLRQVQDLLGHADPKTTAIYAHVNDRYASNPALGIAVQVSGGDG